ncbi:MAG: DUF1385 domain-containing protein [Deltaproteobacteria bacterium]|jgi:uncharacterized protein YqhQ|nr:DUF1385 domain-containing protein [Deltaproteobacteria bacterium]
MKADEGKDSLAVGGQAVMEGVMMRNGDVYSIAVRQGDDRIVVETRPWFELGKGGFLKKPGIRGFPLLLETMINGIKALNRSAELAIAAEGEELKTWQMALTLAAALLFAVGLFIVVPHLITVLLSHLSVAGGVEGFSFHLWDGLIKFSIFLLYIALISRLSDIRRVFQYHGAEHKSIAAYESGACPVDARLAETQSRLHPRCGTTFLLFVLSIAILMHVLLVPLLLLFWVPDGPVQKHTVILLLKFALMAPISALAYEAIRLGARLGDTLPGKIMRAPGLLLQILTTREPDSKQLEVALAALNEALKRGSEHEETQVLSPPYDIMEQR